MNTQELPLFIQLQAKTNKGKNVIHNHGDKWMVLLEQDNVIALNGDKGWMIESKITHEKRWIRVVQDEDFTWEDGK